MTARTHPLAIACLTLLAAACGTKPTGKLFITWPENGSTVHEDSAIVFGYSDVNVSGKVQVVFGDHAHDAGTFPTPREQGRYELHEKPGKHTIKVRLVDTAGKPFEPSIETSLDLTIAATPAGRKVWFVEPADGAKVKSPVTVRFGLSGMNLVPAGTEPLDKTQGHHHVIIDGTPRAAGENLPMGEKNLLHFGKAQTEAQIELPPGKHTLTLQFADAGHFSYGPNMSATITLDVE